MILKERSKREKGTLSPPTSPPVSPPVSPPGSPPVSPSSRSRKSTKEREKEKREREERRKEDGERKKSHQAVDTTFGSGDRNHHSQSHSHSHQRDVPRRSSSRKFRISISLGSPTPAPLSPHRYPITPTASRQGLPPSPPSFSLSISNPPFSSNSGLTSPLVIHHSSSASIPSTSVSTAPAAMKKSASQSRSKHFSPRGTSTSTDSRPKIDAKGKEGGKKTGDGPSVVQSRSRSQSGSTPSSVVKLIKGK
eukprot:TRINITY_DN3589_c1_g1_i2.p1 TRINITY_DN3589_c1_g1~~TRINITY_DN3589_c1_g1_i2.p1  ORF type:complete len:250 (-),score=66.76 TRINITY_DN3589_c1_g1_i2:126-875(-)